MKRLALMLLALFMVPVVIVATPGVANAATKYSGTVATGFRHDSWVPGEWADCTFTAFYAVEGSAAAGYTQTVKTKNGDCTTGANYNLEGAAVTLQYNGMTGTGVECAGSASFALGSNEVMPDSSASMTVFAGPASALCEVQELCWSFVKSQTFADDHSGNGCEPLTMGTPALPGAAAVPTGCTTGGPTGPPTATWRVVGSDHFLDYTLPMKAQTTASETWQLWPIFDQSNGTYAGDSRFNVTLTKPTTAAYTWTASRSQHYIQLGGTQATANAYHDKLVGVMVFNSDRAATDYPGWTDPPYIAITRAMNTGATPGSDVGWTHGPSCLWYFGPKIRASDTHGRDVPAGTINGAEVQEPEPAPVNTAPISKPEACTFSLTDPTTWLEGGMCAAVGLLGAIWNTLGDVVSAVLGIPAAILDGLSGLFVPDDGYLNSKTTQLKTSWNNTQPGAWTGAVTDQAWDLPAGGCSGVPLNFDLPGGVQVDEHLGEACTGTMATVAATTKLAASAILVIFGALACLRALGSGFGWNPSIGRGESA